MANCDIVEMKDISSKNRDFLKVFPKLFHSWGKTDFSLKLLKTIFMQRMVIKVDEAGLKSTLLHTAN
jgi:hypothetical protein